MSRAYRCKWGCGASFNTLRAAFIHERGRRCPNRAAKNEERTRRKKLVNEAKQRGKESKISGNRKKKDK